MEFTVIEFYNRMRNACVGLPLWDQLHPQHQYQVVNAVNLLLAVCYDNGATGKTTEENT